MQHLIEGPVEAVRAEDKRHLVMEASSWQHAVSPNVVAGLPAPMSHVGTVLYCTVLFCSVRSTQARNCDDDGEEHLQFPCSRSRLPPSSRANEAP